MAVHGGNPRTKSGLQAIRKIAIAQSPKNAYTRAIGKVAAMITNNVSRVGIISDPSFVFKLPPIK